MYAVKSVFRNAKPGRSHDARSPGRNLMTFGSAPPLMPVMIEKSLIGPMEKSFFVILPRLK